MGKLDFFDVEERLKRLSDLGDRLEAFVHAVDFEIFRFELVKALSYSNGSRSGRPAFDPVTMFKILVIQAAHSLSDEHAEFLIGDRLFLGLGLSAGCAHDLAFSQEAHESRCHPGTIQALFERFESALRASGYIAMSGRIVGASLVVRTVGIARATMKIGMANIVYNAKRLICLQKAAMA